MNRKCTVNRGNFISVIFQHAADEAPDHAAVVCMDQQLSFRELNTRANQLAHYLRKLCVKPETLIGVYVDRSVETIVGILGVLKSGGAYVPLDPAYPKERISFMLEDARPLVLLTQKHLVGNLPNHVGQTVTLDDDWSSIARYSSQNPVTVSEANHLAYVIYTSGSTGQPKGVMITHGNLSHYVQAISVPMQLSRSDRYLHTASFSFSSSVRQMMVPLSQGVTVVIAVSAEIKNPLMLFETVRRNNVTIMDLVPCYWRNCIHALRSLEVDERNKLLSNTVRLIMSASEPLLSDVPADWSAKLYHRAQLVNMFGQTETTGIVSTCRIPESNEDRVKVVPIGTPIENTQIYLLDEQLQPVPFGELGEIYIGGPGVGRGYLNQPHLTAEKFISDPFSDQPGARIYKTGDMGRYLPDGNIDFLGRLDNQVKIRGHRVELGEIEGEIRSYPGVRDAVVVAREDEVGSQRLIAYLVADVSCAPSIAERERYRLANNMNIVQQNKHETDFFYQQIFVDQTNFRHGITLEDGDCVFDVGANIGLFTMFVQQVRKQLRVYAFEPIPAIFETLQINASLYGKDAKLFPFGLSSQSQTVEFTYYPHSTTQSGRYGNIEQDREVLRKIISNQKKASGSIWEEYVDAVVDDRVKGETVLCELKTLSEVIQEEEIERIDLLKLDAEKSELDVLNGITENDWHKIRQIVIEAYESGGQLKGIVELLKKQGYDVVVEEDKYIEASGLCNVYARRINSSEQKTNDKLFPIPVVDGAILSQKDLRRYLQEKLPEYLMPSALVFLDRLPLSATGKVDRQALPAPTRERFESEEAIVAPRNSVEIRLAEAWRDVLKLERVGIHDNFIELGGDSILAIQICARARNAGIRITPAQLFEHETIARLSSVASDYQSRDTVQGLVTGTVPLTPVQTRFFEQELPQPDYYNQTVVLTLREEPDMRILERAMRYLVEHHDLLRARYSGREGPLQQIIVGTDDLVGVSRIDLSSVPEGDQAAAMKKVISEVEGSLSLSKGPLSRAAVIDLGIKKSPRLLITIHHLAVDGVSWRIITEDLQTLYKQMSSGKKVSLPSKTTSFKDWAERLVDYARSPEIKSENEYWLSQPFHRASRLPVDFSGDNTYEASACISVSLELDDTKAILQEVPRIYHTQINDVLLTALISSFGQWTANRSLLIDLEGHGREDIVDGVDLSRTVGWFAAIFPVFLEIQNSDDLSSTLRNVKDQLRAVPQKGIGYGVMRYLSGDSNIRERLSTLPQPEVRFNYLGQFDQGFDKYSPFGWANELPGPVNALRGPRRHLLEIDGLVSGNRLRFNWTYGERIHRRATVERLAQNFVDTLRLLVPKADSFNKSTIETSGLLKTRLSPQDLAKFLQTLNRAQ